MEQQKEAFRKQGFGVAAITYDSPALLRDFAQRKGIAYPLLGDSDSKIIRAFGILNENYPPNHPWYGIPFPGTYVVDGQGIVRAKYFEEDHADRYTAANILVRQFDDADGLTWNETDTNHLKVRYSTSDSVVRPGCRIVLLLDIELQPGIHVYAPGVREEYIPIEWAVGDSPGWLVQPASYPASEKLHFEVLNETLPVYQGTFRMERDVTFGQGKQLVPLLHPGQQLVIEGSFRYQACDDTQCFPPQTVPLQWAFRVEGHDPKRAPEQLRRAP